MQLTHTRKARVAVMRMVLAPTVYKAEHTDSMISGLRLHKASWRVLDEVLNNRLIHRDLVMHITPQEIKSNILWHGPLAHSFNPQFASSSFSNHRTVFVGKYV